MNKAELVKLLNENFDDEDEVFFTYNYGDHWNSQVVQRVKYVGSCNISWSEYHRMHKLIDSDSSEQPELKNQLVLGHDRDPIEFSGDLIQ